MLIKMNKIKTLLTVIIFMLTLAWFVNCHEHHHDHHHHHHHEESPSFKYSYEANKNAKSHMKQHSSHSHEEVKHDRDSIDNDNVWMFSLVSTLIISIAPFLLLFLIPLDNTDRMKPRLKLLLAFASGGLLGDAFLHLIPHATHPHTHHNDHDHGDHHHHHDHSHKGSHDHNMVIGLWVLAGIVTFLAVEKFVRLFKGSDAGHSHGSQKNDKSVKQTASGNNKKTTKDFKKQKIEKIDISGYLNLAADFAHNFTDGLAIGASYYAGYNVGIVTTMTILLHEVPHEIGDFAILIKSGCSRRKALFLQLLTAVGAFGGNILVLLGSNSNSDTAPWFLPFTAGGFIYIATVSVLPELLEESTKLWQSIKEITALLTGVALMVLIAKFE